MITVYSVTGYYKGEDEDDTFTVLMTDSDDVLPEIDFVKEGDHTIEYYDEDIYFYGVNPTSLQYAIDNKEEFGDFIPVIFAIDGYIEV